MSSINDASYSDVAALAISQPGVWTPLRQGQATANLVTQINSGKHPAFQEREFVARSRSWVYDSASKRKYDIEVRLTERTPSDVHDLAVRITQSIMPSIERLITEAIESELSGRL